MSGRLISLNPVQRAVVAPFVLHGFADLNLLDSSALLYYCACVPLTMMAGNWLPTETLCVFVWLSCLHVRHEPLDLIASLLICSFQDETMWKISLSCLNVDILRFQKIIRSLGMLSLFLTHTLSDCSNLAIFFGIDFVFLYFCTVHVLWSKTVSPEIFGLISLCSFRLIPESVAVSTNSLWAAIGLATSHIILHLQAN